MQVTIENQKHAARCAGCHKILEKGNRKVGVCQRARHKALGKPYNYHPACFIEKAQDAIDKVYNDL